MLSISSFILSINLRCVASLPLSTGAITMTELLSCPTVASTAVGFSIGATNLVYDMSSPLPNINAGTSKSMAIATIVLRCLIEKLPVFLKEGSLMRCAVLSLILVVNSMRQG